MKEFGGGKVEKGVMSRFQDVKVSVWDRVIPRKGGRGSSLG